MQAPFPHFDGFPFPERDETVLRNAVYSGWRALQDIESREKVQGEYCYILHCLAYYGYRLPSQQVNHTQGFETGEHYDRSRRLY